MIHPYTASVFASVRRHFDNPCTESAAVVSLAPRIEEGEEPIRMTAAEAYASVYGPDTDAPRAAEVWEAVLNAARDDLTPQGTPRLLFLWLTLPRLSGTAYRICRRLPVDRSDVESEMTLALFEEMATIDPADPSSVTLLISAARTRAWRYARAGLREVPSTRVENLAQDRALAAVEPAAAPATRHGLDIQVDRPDGPDGLRAPLRFRVCPEDLRDDARAVTEDRTRTRTGKRHPRTRRAPKPVGSLPTRPAKRLR